MALYDYELSIICDGSGKPLSTTLIERGLLDSADHRGNAMLLGMRVFVVDLAIDVEGAPIRGTRILFDAEPFEACIVARFANFVAWLWEIAREIEPLTMFVPSGSDARPLEASADDPFGDITGLLTSGVPSAAHPIVYYSEALADGALCQIRERVDYYEVERRPGLGCLYLFVSRSEAGVEILETGSLQREMLAQLRP